MGGFETTTADWTTITVKLTNGNCLGSDLEEGRLYQRCVAEWESEYWWYETNLSTMTPSMEAEDSYVAEKKVTRYYVES